MESCKLEIVLHSAEDLLDVKVFGTMDPYALLCITNSYGGLSSVQYKTSVAQKAGCNPIWNSSMQFEVGSMTNSYNLFCEINHDGTLFDRKIGEVRVPFTNLLAGNAFGEKVRYPVKLDNGEVVGKIILSHKFSNPAVMSSGANNTSKVSSTTGAKDTNKAPAKSGANNTDKVYGTSGAKNTSKVSDTSRAKNTSKVSGTTGAKNTSKVSDTSGAKNTSKVSGTSGAKNTSKVSTGTSGANNTSKVSGKSGAKQWRTHLVPSRSLRYGSNFYGSATGAKNTSKVSAGTSGTKNRKPRKKVQGKENGGLDKNIAMDVGTGSLLLAGTAGITLAGLDILHDEDENLAEYEDVDVGLNVDVDVVDEDEDEDEDEDADADADEDVDVDACEYEDEEEDDDDEDEEEDDGDEDDNDDEDSFSDSD